MPTDSEIIYLLKILSLHGPIIWSDRPDEVSIIDYDRILSLRKLDYWLKDHFYIHAIDDIFIFLEKEEFKTYQYELSHVIELLIEKFPTYIVDKIEKLWSKNSGMEEEILDILTLSKNSYAIHLLNAIIENEKKSETKRIDDNLIGEYEDEIKRKKIK